MSNRAEGIDECEGDECCMSLTRSSLTLAWIFLERLKIFTLTIHDLRNTQDTQVKAQPPQPIARPVLPLTFTSAGCCLWQSSAPTPQKYL